MTVTPSHGEAYSRESLPLRHRVDGPAWTSPCAKQGAATYPAHGQISTHHPHEHSNRIRTDWHQGLLQDRQLDLQRQQRVPILPQSIPGWQWPTGVRNGRHDGGWVVKLVNLVPSIVIADDPTRPESLPTSEL